MSFQRLYAIASQLPMDSPLRRAVVGPEEFQWTAELRMLASIHEEIQKVEWTMGMLNAHKYKGKKNPVPEPELIPRPGVDPKKIKKNAKRAKPGGLVFGARGKNQTETEQNQVALRRFFGADGRKTGR